MLISNQYENDKLFNFKLSRIIRFLYYCNESQGIIVKGLLNESQNLGNTLPQLQHCNNSWHCTASILGAVSH